MCNNFNKVRRITMKETEDLYIKPVIQKFKKFKELRGKMKVSIIPKFLLEDESITDLKDMGVKFDEGHVVIGGYKVGCIKVYNLSETQVFDKLESKSLLEAASTATDAELKTYSSRNLSFQN